MPEQLGGASAPVPLTGLVLNLLLGAGLSVLLMWHYVRFGRSLANRAALARTFPFISLTTILVITVVKSSLALSLGLVGALSIVRFRTPIKEPEELAYLFLAIAIGLGLGANQVSVTVTAVPFVMVIVALLASRSVQKREENLFLDVTVPASADPTAEFGAINAVLAEHVDLADVRRMDVSGDELQATYLVKCEQSERLVQAIAELRKRLPAATISFVEQQNYLGG